jgi:hypothetical protein
MMQGNDIRLYFVNQSHTWSVGGKSFQSDPARKVWLCQPFLHGSAKVSKEGAEKQNILPRFDVWHYGPISNVYQNLSVRLQTTTSVGYFVCTFTFF